MNPTANFGRPAGTNRDTPIHYHPGLMETSPPGSILLSGPNPLQPSIESYRIILRVDGSVSTILEAKYQSLFITDSP